MTPFGTGPMQWGGEADGGTFGGVHLVGSVPHIAQPAAGSQSLLVYGERTSYDGSQAVEHVGEPVGWCFRHANGTHLHQDSEAAGFWFKQRLEGAGSQAPGSYL